MPINQLAGEKSELVGNHPIFWAARRHLAALQPERLRWCAGRAAALWSGDTAAGWLPRSAKLHGFRAPKKVPRDEKNGG